MNQQNLQRESQKSCLKGLIARGKEQGYLTYTEVNDHLSDNITDPEQIEEIIRMMNDIGIHLSEDIPARGCVEEPTKVAGF